MMVCDWTCIQDAVPQGSLIGGMAGLFFYQAGLFVSVWRVCLCRVESQGLLCQHNSVIQRKGSQEQPMCFSGQHTLGAWLSCTSRAERILW